MEIRCISGRIDECMSIVGFHMQERIQIIIHEHYAPGPGIYANSKSTIQASPTSKATTFRIATMDSSPPSTRSSNNKGIFANAPLPSASCPRVEGQPEPGG